MTPRERLRESLARNAEHIRTHWTREMRESISAALIFRTRPIACSDNLAYSEDMSTTQNTAWICPKCHALNPTRRCGCATQQRVGVHPDDISLPGFTSEGKKVRP